MVKPVVLVECSSYRDGKLFEREGLSGSREFTHLLGRSVITEMKNAKWDHKRLFFSMDVGYLNRSIVS